MQNLHSAKMLPILIESRKFDFECLSKQQRRWIWLSFCLQSNRNPENPSSRNYRPKMFLYPSFLVLLYFLGFFAALFFAHLLCVSYDINSLYPLLVVVHVCHHHHHYHHPLMWKCIADSTAFFKDFFTFSLPLSLSTSFLSSEWWIHCLIIVL